MLERRRQRIRRLKKYTPTRFKAANSTYNKTLADYAVSFIEALCHTKGTWAGKPFELIDWQEQIIRDIFGTIKPNGYRQFNTAYVEIPKKMGKEIALNTPIPTPAGFTTMGKIKVGDIVFDERGKPCKVTHKSEVDYEEQAYRITFKDGEVIEAGENHQWYGEWRSNNKLKSGVVNTDWLYRRYLAPSRECSLDFRIPIADAVETADAELPIEPYLMGYWLGNGTATEPRITIQAGDFAGVLRNIQPYHTVSHIWNNEGDSLHAYVHDLSSVLIDSFHDKVIPIQYLRASKAQRLRLLQGLMDSEGSISTRKGQGIYTSIEKALSESVSELLWSLGIKNGKKVTDVSVTYDSRSATESYEVAFHKVADFAVGDEVQIVFTPMHINTRTRIIAMEYNPFYKYSIRVEVGSYRPTINDNLYRIEKTATDNNDDMSAIWDEFGSMSDSFDSFEADYGNFLDTYKEVQNIAVGTTSFSVTFSDGSVTTYNYTVDSQGRMTSITKAV